ncbi:MAG: hypothetical protein IJN25_10395 [Clostridia bacterium]|nr:hypothetical protein [Clostridia bacterium]
MASEWIGITDNEIEKIKIHITLLKIIFFTENIHLPPYRCISAENKVVEKPLTNFSVHATIYS